MQTAVPGAAAGSSSPMIKSPLPQSVGGRNIASPHDLEAKTSMIQQKHGRRVRLHPSPPFPMLRCNVASIRRGGGGAPTSTLEKGGGVQATTSSGSWISWLPHHVVMQYFFHPPYRFGGGLFTQIARCLELVWLVLTLAGWQRSSSWWRCR